MHLCLEEESGDGTLWALAIPPQAGARVVQGKHVHTDGGLLWHTLSMSVYH
jgi:hypothetical protein